MIVALASGSVALRLTHDGSDICRFSATEVPFRSMAGWRLGLPRTGCFSGRNHRRFPRCVAEPVPVVVRIGVVLYAVSVQVFHYVGNVDDEGLCQRGVVFVGCLYPDVQGCGVGLVVEGGGGAEGAVGIQGE